MAYEEFNEHSLGAFMRAHDAATQLLQSESSLRKDLSWPDALVLQAASRLVQREVEGFTISQVKEISPFPYSTVAASLAWYTELEVFTAEDRKIIRGRPTKIYSPTELGHRTLSLFQTRTV